jgi:hypothetical protein
MIKMFENDTNRMILLKTVNLNQVSGETLRKFFEKISNDEIDFDLLESLKERLIADYSDLQRFSKRWTTKIKVLSSREITELFQVLNSYFGEEENALLQVKLLIEQNKQQKLEIKTLQQKNIEVEKQITHLKSENKSLRQ